MFPYLTFATSFLFIIRFTEINGDLDNDDLEAILVSSLKELRADIGNLHKTLEMLESKQNEFASKLENVISEVKEIKEVQTNNKDMLESKQNDFVSKLENVISEVKEIKEMQTNNKGTVISSGNESNHDSKLEDVLSEIEDIKQHSVLHELILKQVYQTTTVRSAVPAGFTCESFDVSYFFPQGNERKEKFECMVDCIKEKCAYISFSEEGMCFIGGLGKHEPNITSSWSPFKFVHLTYDIGKAQTDVARNKPAIAAPVMDDMLAYQAKAANHDDYKLVVYSSTTMTRPWWMVDLQNTYKIVRISINAMWWNEENLENFYKPLKVYVTNEDVFKNNSPDFSKLALFRDRPDTVEQLTLRIWFEKPEGQCGRYIVIMKDEQDTKLEVGYFHAEGHLFD